MLQQQLPQLWFDEKFLILINNRNTLYAIISLLIMLVFYLGYHLGQKRMREEKDAHIKMLEERVRQLEKDKEFEETGKNCFNFPMTSQECLESLMKQNNKREGDIRAEQ